MNKPIETNSIQKSINKNIDRILAIKALRNIRQFIDDMEGQDKINKKIVYAVAILTVLAIIFLIIFMSRYYTSSGQVMPDTLPVNVSYVSGYISEFCKG